MCHKEGYVWKRVTVNSSGLSSFFCPLNGHKWVAIYLWQTSADLSHPYVLGWLGPGFNRTDGSQTTKIKLCNVLIVSALAIHGETASGWTAHWFWWLVPAIGKVIVAILELTRVNVSKLDFEEGLRSSFRRYRADPGSIWSSGDFLITWPTARLCVIQVSDLSASDGNVLACHGCEANLFCWSGLRSAN